jgi:hypothetical protein
LRAATSGKGSHAAASGATFREPPSLPVHASDVPRWRESPAAEFGGDRSGGRHFRQWPSVKTPPGTSTLAPFDAFYGTRRTPALSETRAGTSHAASG